MDDRGPQFVIRELRATVLRKLRATVLATVGSFCWVFTLFFASTCLTFAGDQPSIQVERPWMRAVPNAMDVTAVYMTIVNNGGSSARLVGGSTGIADSVQPMVTTKEGQGLKQVLGMKGVDALEIPPHSKLVLEPNGNHLMVTGLKQHPKEGDQIDFTIKLEPGDQELHLKIPVSRTPVK
jgi:periplasmic copper chaperone A